MEGRRSPHCIRPSFCRRSRASSALRFCGGGGPSAATEPPSAYGIRSDCGISPAAGCCCCGGGGGTMSPAGIGALPGGPRVAADGQRSALRMPARAKARPSALRRSLVSLICRLLARSLEARLARVRVRVRVRG